MSVLTRVLSELGLLWALVTLGGVLGILCSWQLTRGTISSPYFMPVALGIVLVVVVAGLSLDRRGYLS
ncbi:hypothetical protein [Haloferax marisrubri]|uniref:Uncharacterized protein n=1 Tax=Haloferax marisrubri TaxID=1544719 RepID=A0A2P4NWK4_9EURY|nr:hypothetical protein [Haloferax marisrubri]POG57526.1 hypothetical protein AUR65_001245 [Haloferax marisrubri]